MIYKISFLFFFIVIAYSQKSIKQFGDLDNLIKLKASSHKSIFEALQVEPINSETLLIKRAKLTIEFIDAYQVLIVSKKLNGISTSLPVVVEKQRYQNSLDIMHSIALIQKLALEKMAKDNSSSSENDFKFGTNYRSDVFESIFGSSEISLSITGNIEIDISGKTRYQKGEENYSRTGKNGSFSPDLKLRQQFYLEGKIGDKLTITANQNSEADFDLENVLKIKYRGYEDEVIQSIEAGNVSLNLPGSSLISNTERHQGLFGIKAKLQFGNLYFTGIASIIKGKKQKKSFKNGTSSNNSGNENADADRIKDYDYVKYRFFFVDTIFRNAFESYFPLKDPSVEGEVGVVINLNVYVSASGNDNISETKWATAVVDKSHLSMVGTNMFKTGVFETSAFKKLQENVDFFYDKDLGYFYLSSDYEDKTIAISYNFIDAQKGQVLLPWMSDDDFNLNGVDRDSYLKFRNSSSNLSGKYLKLIKSKNQKRSNTAQIAYRNLEKLHMKNVYNFNYKNNKDLRVTIFKEIKTQISPNIPERFKEINYLSIFGLDRLDATGKTIANNHKGDGIIDYTRKLLFEPLVPKFLMFPFLQPFEPSEKAQENMNLIELTESSGNFKWQDEFKSNGIYTYSSSVREAKYYIEVKGESTGRRSISNSESNEFKIAFGILPGSERVQINKDVMERGLDYDINYFTGLLVLKSSRAILGKNNLEVEYETANLFQLNKQTLLGSRLEYKFKNGFLGGTALYLKKSSLDEKIRIGNEPFENFSWGLNGRYTGKLNFLTDFANVLPGIKTKAESKFSVSAEFAHLIQNPNTQNNEKINENDGVAYIDDFEAAKRVNGLSLRRIAWVPASLPNLINGDEVNPIIAEDGRAQTTFFNPFHRYPATYIFDREISRSALDEVEILNLIIRKETKIYDSKNKEIIVNEVVGKRKFKPKTPKNKAWAGVMASNRYNSDLTNVRFLEVWVRWDYPNKNAVEPVLNIDFGNISEDYYTKDQVLQTLASEYTKQGDSFLNKIVLGRNVQSSEDVLGSENNNLNVELEDVGLDRMNDSEERMLYGIANLYDNWQAIKEPARTRTFAGVEEDIFDFEHDLKDEIKAILPWRINSTEGNSKSIGGKYPDKEDIDHDGTFDVQNNYFHVEIPMKRSIDDMKNHPYFSAIGKKAELGWVQFRIPIRDLIKKGHYYSDSFPRSIPSLTNVDFIRVYVDQFDGLDDDDVILVNFAGINFVGTDWQSIPPKDYDDISFTNAEIGQESDEIEIRFLNSDENQNTLNSANFYADYYISPAGVQGDFVDTERTARSKEQSLVLDIKDLKAGQKIEVYKSSQFITRNFSLHNYKKIRMFMRTQLLDINENDIRYELPKSRDEFKESTAHRNYFYIKLGTTSENFYEYRVPIIGNKLPDNYTEPDSKDKNLQNSYWLDTSIEIDLDLLSAVKNKGFQEYFGSKFTGYYLYENPNDTLMERYRAVGSPDITNLKYIILGVYNADKLGQRPLRTQIWVNELRASEVRKEDASAILMQLNTNIADVFNISANFTNRDANFHEINRTSSGKSSVSKESQTFNVGFSPHKFLPNSWGISLPVSFSLNNSYSIPKYFPGTDIQTFYRNDGVIDKVKHMFGFGNFSEEIKRVYSWASSKSVSFSLSKSSTKKAWYNRIFFNPIKYTGRLNRSQSSTNLIAGKNSETLSHGFNYNLSFSKRNFFKPFAFLGRGSFLDEISQMKVFFSPESFAAKLSLNQSESQLRRRNQRADNPIFNASSTRNFAIKYRLTDAIFSSFDRSYRSNIATEMQNDRRMTITDAFLNIFYQPFATNAFGNDYQINTNFRFDYRPRFYNGLTSAFSYRSSFSYKEEVTKNYSTQGTNQSYSYKLGMSPSRQFKRLFGWTSSRGSHSSGTRGRRRGGSAGQKFTNGVSNSSVRSSSISSFYDGKKSKGFDMSILNPLVWGKEFLLSWNKIDFLYEVKNGYNHSLLQQKLAPLSFQLGFSSDVSVPSIGNERLGEAESRNLSLKNSFNFGKISVSFTNTVKQTRSLKEFGNQKKNSDYTYFSLSDDFDIYRSFRKSDSLNTTKPLGTLIPNWTVRISGIEKLPLLKLIAKSASLRHIRNGKVRLDYTDNVVTGNPIESYRYTASNSFSPLIGLQIKTKFDVNIDFSLGKSENFNLSSSRSGTQTKKNDYSLNFTYRKTGGFRFPFKFWPFNGAYVKNSIDFGIRISRRETRVKTYRRISGGRNNFTTGNFDKTFSLEPSISYKFSNTITGSIFYRYNESESSRTELTRVNEFGIKVNLRIQN